MERKRINRVGHAVHVDDPGRAAAHNFKILYRRGTGAKNAGEPTTTENKP